MTPDKTAVVLTGASAGIGNTVLETISAEAYVIAVSRTRPQPTSFNGHWIHGDLSTPNIVLGKILDLLYTEQRSLDGLIHCAVSYGTNHRHPFLETEVGEWDEVMTVNVRSQFILTLGLLPLLLERSKTFIISLTSDVATSPGPHRIAYACSKAASYALFTGLAAELAESSVSVIQMLPERQVVTRGLRRRRAPDFHFSGYSSPEIFRSSFKSILKNRGSGLNGACLVVSEKGMKNIRTSCKSS